MSNGFLEIMDNLSNWFILFAIWSYRYGVQGKFYLPYNYTYVFHLLTI